MKGTDKQLAWANDLQAKAISAFEWARLNPPADGQTQPERWSEGIDLLIGRIRSAANASDIIDAFSTVNFSKPSDQTFMRLVSIMYSKAIACKF